MIITIKDLIDYCADSNIELESLYNISLNNKELLAQIELYLKVVNNVKCI